MSTKAKRAITITFVALLIGLLVPSFSALADGPDQKLAYGLLPSPPGDYPQLNLSGDAELPEAVDLSGHMPPVGNQGSLSSCVGWAIGYYVRSYQEGLEAGRIPTSDAEIFSPSFIYGLRSTSNCTRDNGMSLYNGIHIAIDTGVSTLATMPYDSTDPCACPSDEAFAEAANYTASSYANVFSGKGTANLNEIKQLLAEGTPVLLAAPVYDEFVRDGRAGDPIDAPADGSCYRGGHAIALVGYNDADATFKFVNSWGSGWGDAGYGYLTYYYVQDAAWEAWVLFDADTSAPELADEALEVGGVENGIAQSDVDAPVFIWERSAGADTVYQVYWGTDAEGIADLTVEEPTFAPEQVTGPTTAFLRVRAIDAAGNASEWKTLFTYIYEMRFEGSPEGIVKVVVSF